MSVLKVKQWTKFSSTCFWNDYLKCEELTITMHQNDPLLINTLNRSRKATHNAIDVNTINSLCHKQPPNDSTLPHLFYMNKHIIAHNIEVFNNAKRFYLSLRSKHHFLPTKFEILND